MVVIFINMENIIYKVKNILNGKLYIGCTTTGLQHRMKEHRYSCESKNRKSKFCSAIIKYGFDNFDFTILEKCNTPKEMFEREMYYIKLYETKENGYNLTNGGEGCIGYKHTDDTKILLSELLLEKHPHKDKSYDDIYGTNSEKQRKIRSKATKMFWDNLDPKEREERIKKLKENGEIIRLSGRVKCSNNPFSKSMIIDGKTYGCWSEAIETLSMSKYLIKKKFKIER
jgi:group I intron endonuclease